MHSIFWKIFLSFWLSMVLIVGVAVISSFKLAGERLEAIDEFNRRDVLRTAAEVFEEQGVEGFKDWITKTDALPPDQTLYLIDDMGNEVINRRLPPKIRDPKFLARMLGAERRYRGKRMRDGRPLQYVAPNGVEYRPIFGAKAPPVFGVLGIPKNALFLLLAGMLISAFMCYLLTRYLTRPLAGMVKASQDLAEGNLSSRVGESAYRGDEIGQLAQQFDQMAQNFEQQIDSRRTLFRNISHELRSPLARIKVALELAHRKPDEAVRHLERIETESDNIEHLISQVLELVRAQQHDHNEAQAINLIAIINSVVEDAQFEGLPDNKTVSWSPPEHSVLVQGRKTLIRSMIENVIRNAIAYTEPNSSVEIALSQRDGSVSLSVRDFGPGVEDSELSSIFEPFYRSPSSQDHLGSGIGLAITAQAVNVMGGTIEALNAPSKGLIVSMNLPVIPTT